MWGFRAASPVKKLAAAEAGERPQSGPELPFAFGIDSLRRVLKNLL